MTAKNKNAFGRIAAVIVLLGGSAAVALGLFPPWRIKVTSSSVGTNKTWYNRSTERAFIGSEPETRARIGEPQINLWQLHVEWTVVLIVVVTLITALYLFLGGRGHKPPD